MRYLHVEWRHDDPADPIRLLSELDDQSWEVRKVEVFRDGTLGMADGRRSSGGTRLGLEPVPPLEAINQIAEFSGTEISREEFEAAWAAADPAAPPLTARST